MEIFNLGKIPMRHLVYRVQSLPQSLLPLVWDFGTLKSGSVDSVEGTYIRRMIDKCVSLFFSAEIETIFNDIITTNGNSIQCPPADCGVN